MKANKTFSKFCNKESTFKITVSQWALIDVVGNYEQREEKKVVVLISDQGSLVKK